MAAPLVTPDEVALCTREHTAGRKKRGGTGPEYKMFSAAAEGCLQCVRYYVERAEIPYNAKSEISGYTALDFAQWAASQEQTDTQAVQRYLRMRVHAAQGLVPVVFSGPTAEGEPAAARAEAEEAARHNEESRAEAALETQRLAEREAVAAAARRKKIKQECTPEEEQILMDVARLRIQRGTERRP